MTPEEDLARSFADGEHRLRTLLWELVHGGDRRRLLTEALEVFVNLRRVAAGVSDRRLALKLDRAAQSASVGAREAFRRESGNPTPEVLLRIHDPEHPAVTDENHRRLGSLRRGRSGSRPTRPWIICA